MSQLKYTKLKNKEEIFSYAEEDPEHKTTKLIEPLVLVYDPSYGMVAKYWVTFGETKDAIIENCDIMFSVPANEKAVTYYNQFISATQTVTDSSPTGNDTSNIDGYTDEDLEEIFTHTLSSNKLH